MARYDFRTQRLFVDVPLLEGQAIEVDRAQANYLLNVIRLKEHDPILLFNGRDGEWLGALRPSGRKSCSIDLIEQVREQTEPNRLEYLFAPLKLARLDYMVQKSVEMGAGTLRPVLTHHTQVQKVKTDRMRANAVEAAEQCGILSIPDVHETEKLNIVLENWNPEVPIFFCDEHLEHPNDAVLNKKASAPDVAVLVGPEGGFSVQERELLHSYDFVAPISLGPRILRADTAAVAVLSLVQAARERW